MAQLNQHKEKKDMTQVDKTWPKCSAGECGRQTPKKICEIPLWGTPPTLNVCVGGTVKMTGYHSYD